MELQRRATAQDLPLASTAAHPGLCSTGLVADREGMGANRIVRAFGPVFVKAFTQSATAGARSTLFAATVAEPGSYTGPQRFGETRGPVGPAKVSALAQDDVLARRLWSISVELTGFRYLWQRP